MISMKPSSPDSAHAPSESLLSPRPSLSLVVPVVERSQNVEAVYHAYSTILAKTAIVFECIFVVDGGDGAIVESLEKLQHNNNLVKIISLPYSFGESTALVVGFERADGELIVTLPAYFQTVPEGIERVLGRLNEGYDVVVTRRFPRVDSWVGQLQTRLFNFLSTRLTGIECHDLGSGLRGMRQIVTKEVHLYGDLHRFLPLLARQKGFRISEVDIPQHPADGDYRVYRPGVYLRRVLDLLTVVFLFKFTKKPLRFFGLIGSGLFASGFFVSFLLAVEKIFGMTALADRPLLILGVLLMVLGVQVGSIGLLGEIIIFTHARKVKDYTIRKFLR